MNGKQPEIDRAFWDNLFQQQRMPWDHKGTPEKLKQYLNQFQGQQQHVFIPGCGAAYEVACFVENGHQVIAMDYSSQAVNTAKQILGDYGCYVTLGDVFSYPETECFDLIYERAFLAALSVELRSNYFSMLNKLLKPSGLVAGFFVIDDNYRSRFPPFCLKSGELEQNMDHNFELLECEEVENSVEVFSGREYWMVWRKVTSAKLRL